MEQFKSDPGGIPEPDFGSGETNRERATRWFREVWNERRTETIDELFAPGAIGHTENGDQGPTEFKAAREGLLNAFPDMQVEVEDTTADSDDAVVRWRARATNSGDGLGMPPTNRKVEFLGMTWLTFKNGAACGVCRSKNSLSLLLRSTELGGFGSPPIHRRS